MQEFHGGLGNAKPLLDEVSKVRHKITKGFHWFRGPFESKAEAAALKEGGEALRRKVALQAEHEDRSCLWAVEKLIQPKRVEILCRTNYWGVVGFVGRGKAEVADSAGSLEQLHIL